MTMTAGHGTRPAAVCAPGPSTLVRSGKVRSGKVRTITVRRTIARWLKFNFVGGIGVAVQVAALFLLKGVLGMQYLVATVVAVETAVVHNFVWHEQFTWADRVGRERGRWKASLGRFARFNVANGAVSILGNVLLMRLLVGRGHLNYLLANAIAIALCSLANFAVSDGWVFDEK